MQSTRSRRAVMWMAMAAGMVCNAHAEEPPEENSANIVQRAATDEERLLGELKDERLWQDATPRFVDNRIELNERQQKKLLSLLREVKVLRPASLVPVLARHIDYNMHEGLPLPRIVPTEESHPAYAALVAIGLPSVSAVLKELKGADASNPSERGRRVRNLAVLCLVKIYDQGGHGKELARARIELEIKSATGDERQRLVDALEHRALK